MTAAAQVVPIGGKLRRGEQRLGHVVGHLDPLEVEEAQRVLRVEESVARRTSLGGTAPARVKAAVKQAKKRLA